MKIEEKAKAYDEMVQRVKELHEAGNALTKKQMEIICPALAESEDERIRKEIINFFECQKRDEPTREDILNKWISYLEKQKENLKSADSIPADCVSDAKFEDRWHKVTDSLPDNGREVLAKDKLGNTLLARYDGEGWDVSVYDDEDYRCHNGISKWREIPSEKQNEQKPSCWDSPVMTHEMIMDEQKEHQNKSDALGKTLGRDLTFPQDKDKNLDEIAQDYVDNVKEYNPEPTWDLLQTAVCYGYHYCEKKPIEVLYIPKFRTGDLVRSSKNPRLTYEILGVGSMNELGNPEYEVEIFTDGKPDEPRNLKHIEIEKMDSWGELVKQKPDEIDGKALLHVSNKSYDIGFRDGVASVKPVKWKPQPESLGALMYAIEGKWEMIKTTSYLSRKLEDLYEGLVNTFNVNETFIDELPKTTYTAKDIEELKKLKDKIGASMDEKPAEWDELQAEFRNINEAFEDGKKEVIAHPERYGLCKPAEWSEEDEDMLNSCISSIEEAKENRYAYKETDGDTSYDHEIAWLKLLRNRVGKEFLQPHWTPSGEQMVMLRAVINDPNNAGAEGCQLALKSLYEQLKTIKGERL